MFDIGWSELLVVGLVALIVVGPKELPGMMKRNGQMIRAAKNTASNFQRQFEQAMDEGEIGELKESVKGIRDDLDPHKIMGDVVGVDDDDDFDLDKWNEQILEDELMALRLRKDHAEIWGKFLNSLRVKVRSDQDLYKEVKEDLESWVQEVYSNLGIETDGQFDADLAV